MPKSACTNGSATGIDHMPTLPMVLTATANPSRRHAAGVSTSLSWRSSKSMELPGDEFMTPTSSTWNGETDVHLYTMSALAPKADIVPRSLLCVPRENVILCRRHGNDTRPARLASLKLGLNVSDVASFRKVLASGASLIACRSIDMERFQQSP